MLKAALGLCAAAALGMAVAIPGAEGAGEAPPPPAQKWSFDGIFGTFDRASAQRGFQVYSEVCAGCHGLYHLSYRHLAGIGFNEDEIKAIAAEYEIEDGPDDEGEMFTRAALPADPFVRPYPNEKAAAAANNGAYPPDLSLITKARFDGANYVYALLNGYDEPPAGVEVPDGMNYNTYFPGHQIAMAQPLYGDDVEFADGTAATIEQQSRDLVTFLAWAAEPELEERKQMGVKVLLFLIVFTLLMYAVKRRVWRDVEH